MVISLVIALASSTTACASPTPVPVKFVRRWAGKTTGQLQTGAVEKAGQAPRVTVFVKRDKRWFAYEIAAAQKIETRYTRPMGGTLVLVYSTLPTFPVTMGFDGLLFSGSNDLLACPHIAFPLAPEDERSEDQLSPYELLSFSSVYIDPKGRGELFGKATRCFRYQTSDGGKSWSEPEQVEAGALCKAATR
jgi:hypothetical protein